MRSRNGAASVLLAGVVAFAGFGAWAMVARSAIPLRWHGTVTDIRLVTEKHRGIDDVWFVSVNGRSVHVDAALARTLDVGDRVDKGAWERTLRVDGEPRRLALSRDARRMLVLAPLVVVAAAGIALYPGASWTPGRTR
ncbi:MAG: hypothetical protein QOE45_1209 [Frankiaceae bacterium]|jgi:hypothetical protein|nr:hypothetical protein [Frankiaceae bacterium]